ncbi:hypothetical protein [Nonomuraea sp. NPDC002799]
MTPDDDRPVKDLVDGYAPAGLTEIQRICGDLVGPAQPLAGLLRESVAAGDSASLRRLQTETTPLHDLLNNLLPTEYPTLPEDVVAGLGPPFAAKDTSAVHAVRSVAGLARSLVEAETGDDCLRTGLEWCTVARTSPSSLAWPGAPGGLGDHGEPLTRRLAALSAIAEEHPRLSGAALPVAVTLLSLTGQPVPKGPSASLHVLFSLGDRGLKARLTGTLVPAWPRGLVADPGRMILFTADQDFQLALARAWDQAGRSLDGTVLWSIESTDGPVGTVAGASIGAAFAVLLDELRRRHRPFYRKPALFRLAAPNIVIGEIDDWGNLQPVEGYGQKLEAAGKNARVIVPTPDEQRANQADQGVVIVPAPTWRAAAHQARRPDLGPISRWALIPLLVTVLITAGIVVNRQFAVGQRQREAISRQTFQRSDELLTKNPVVSGLLSATAWHFDHTPEARYGMLALIATSAAAVLQGNSLSVLGTAYSPDGATLAAISGDRVVRLWDAATGRPLGTLHSSHSDANAGLAFSPRGDLLATSDNDGYVQLWNVPARKAIGEPLRHGTDHVELLAFERDGAVLVTASWDGTVRRWDVGTRRPIGEPFQHNAGSPPTALSPDGTTLVTRVDGRAAVQLWDLTTGRRLGAPLAGDAGVAEFSRDGRLLGVAGDEGTRVWEVKTRRPLGRAFKVPGVTTAVTFSPDGATLATGAINGPIRLWDVATGRAAGNALPGHTSSVTALAFDPRRATLASAGSDGTTRLWNLDLLRPTGQPLGRHPRQPFGRHAGAISDAAYRPDGGLFVTSSRDGTTRLWDPHTRLPDGGPLVGHHGQVNTVAFSADGKTLATGGEDRSVRLWDVATHRPVRTLPKAHDGAVLAVAFSPDGRLLASTGDDGTARLWDVATGRQAVQSPLRGHEGPANYVQAVAFSPDGRTLATGGVDVTVRLWEVATGLQIGDPLFQGDAVWNLAISPDGTTLASVTRGGSVLFWNMATHQSIGDPITVPGGVVDGVAFSPDGRTLATGAEDGTARLWDVATHRALGGALAGPEGTTLVAFSPDGTTLAASGADGITRLWNVALPADPFPAVCAIAGRSLTPEEWRTYVPGAPFEELCPHRT